MFQGNTYYDCITVTNSAGTEKEDITPWCPNKVHENKTYIEGQNINCPTPKCSGCEFVLNYVFTLISVQLWNFKDGESKKARFLAKNQYTQRKPLYF